MSAAAATPLPRSENQLVQTVKAYNALVEHQALLTPAEFRLGMIIVRRGGHREGVTISDRHWTSWTGLDPRSKELAIKGLQKKCFRVEGRGDRARFHFERSTWDEFVTKTVQHEKPRTAGRRVDPKPGAKIHPECRDRGCALLHREEAGDNSDLSLVPAIPNAKRVSQTSSGSPGDLCTGSTALSLVTPTPIAKRVSQISADAAEQIWAKTLSCLQAIFPLVGLAFLVRLVAVVRAIFHDVSDDELARAVQFAWRQKKTQKSEGLFLLTVPEAVAAIRRLPAPTKRPDLTEGVRMLLSRAVAALDARGAPFTDVLGEVRAIERDLANGFDLAQLEAIDRRMEELEARIYLCAEAVLTPEEAQHVAAVVEDTARPYVAKMSRVQVEAIKSKARLSQTFALLSIPRLGSFYA